MDIRKVKKLIELLEESNIDELEIKEGETEEDHQVRTSGIENAWLWKELENWDERRCDHRFINLKYWEDQKEVRRRRPNCPLVARDCIVCGDEL